MLCAAAFVAGAASALLLPSLTGAVTEVVGTGSLQSANGRLRLGTNTARITGVVAAGATVAWLGPVWPWLSTRRRTPWRPYCSALSGCPSRSVLNAGRDR
jgi:hypothetical protein